MITINQLAVATEVKPKAAIEFILLGWYALFYSNKRGANTIDMLCWLRWGDRIKPLILMVYGDKNIEHALKLEPFKIYLSKVVLEVNGVVFKAELNAESIITEVTAPSWLRPTTEARMQQVFKSYPHVSLYDAKKHPSMMEKNGKGYVDRTDTKVVEGSIDSIATDGDTATLTVRDTTGQELIAHASRMMLMKAQTGEGSRVELLGTLENNGYSTIMNVCCILPIVRMPLIERVLNISPV